MTPRIFELAALEARQYNILNRSQLRSCGYSDYQVNREIAQRRWQRISSRVVQVDTEKTSRLQELVAAALHFENLVLTGTSALEFEGLEPPHDGRIDLIGPRGGRVEPFPQAVLHTSRLEFTRISDFPMRTSLNLSVAHAMAWANTAEQARFYGYWAMQRKLVSLDDIVGVSLSNPKSQIMKLAIPRVLTLRAQVDSVHEHRFLMLCKKHQLPDPILKPAFVTDFGTVIHADFGFRVGSRFLVVEIDGVQHSTPAAREIDLYRMRVFKDAGAETLRILNEELDDNPDRVMRMLKFRLQRMAA